MQACAVTDIGRKRLINQDCVFESTKPVGGFPDLFLLADGMGGHKAGDYASRFLIESVRKYIQETQERSAVKALSGAVEKANRALYEKSLMDRELAGMGSTVVAAIIEDGFLTVANVGDSRLYIVRDGIRQITRDHSLVEELVSLGELSRDSEDYKKRKNILTRAVGIESTVRIDLFDEELRNGDYLLMCSDGLSNMVDDDEIVSTVTGTGSVIYKANELVRKANQNGGTDNIAVILIRFTEGGDNNA